MRSGGFVGPVLGGSCRDVDPMPRRHSHDTDAWKRRALSGESIKGPWARVAGVRAAGAALALVVGVGAADAAPSTAQAPHKSYVCKYVREAGPGRAAADRSGTRSGSTTTRLLGYDGTVTVGQEFKDGQFRSVVIVANTREAQPRAIRRGLPARHAAADHEDDAAHDAAGHEDDPAPHDDDAPGDAHDHAGDDSGRRSVDLPVAAGQGRCCRGRRHQPARGESRAGPPRAPGPDRPRPRPRPACAPGDAPRCR